MTNKEKFGWLLFFSGFLFASVYAMPNPSQTVSILSGSLSIENIEKPFSLKIPPYYPFSAGFILSLAGVFFMYKKEENEPADGAQEERENNPKKLLEEILYYINEIDFKKMDEEDLQDKIELIQSYQILPFVKNKNELSKKLSISDFTSVFAPFATGERYLNRSWSALVDGYKEESEKSLNISKENFKEAYEQISKTIL